MSSPEAWLVSVVETVQRHGKLEVSIYDDADQVLSGLSIAHKNKLVARIPASAWAEHDSYFVTKKGLAYIGVPLPPSLLARLVELLAHILPKHRVV